MLFGVDVASISLYLIPLSSIQSVGVLSTVGELLLRTC